MTVREIIRTYLGISGLYTLSVSLSWGINTLFLLDAGLDLLETFLANAAFTLAMVLFEIPTGVLADTRGRRASFLASVVVLVVGILCYLGAAHTASGLGPFIAASMVLGLGFTFYSGAVEAWLVDALQHAGYEGEMDRIFARGQMVTGAAMLIGAILGGFLGDLHLSLPFVLRLVLLVPVFALAWYRMKDLGFEPQALEWRAIPREMQRVSRTGVEFGWRQIRVRWMMFVGLVQFGFMMWGFYAWQPYFLELLGRDAVWVAGVVGALMSLSIIVGNALVDRLTRYCGRRTTLLLIASAVETAAAIGIGLADSFTAAVASFLVMMAASGVVGPVKQAYLHASIPSEHRATVISFDSMFQNGGGILGQIGLGHFSRARGIGPAYALGGFATVLALPMLWILRRLGGPADQIVGESAGKKAPCAGQGLPEVSALDTASRQGEVDAHRSGDHHS